MNLKLSFSLVCTLTLATGLRFASGPTPTPAAPTPTPTTLQPANAAQVVPLARWGGNAAGSDAQLVPDPTGQTLALAGSAGVGLYDLATLQEQQRLTLNAPTLRAALSPNAQYLALATAQELQVWQLHPPQTLFTAPLTLAVTALAWQPNAAQLALATPNTLQLFTVPTGTLTQTFTTAQQWQALAISPNGQHLVAGGPAGVQRWDTHTGRSTQLYTPPATQTCHATSAALSLLLACVSATPAQTQLAVRVFDVDNARLIHNTTVVVGSSALQLRALALNPTGTLAAWQVSNSEVQVWALATASATPARLFTYNPGQRVRGLALQDQTLTLLLASERVQVWNLTTFRVQSQYASAPQNIPFTSLALHPTQPIAAVGQANGALNVWDWHTGQLLRTLAAAPPKAQWPRMAGLAFSADGTLVAAASWDARVRVWDWNRLNPRPFFTAVQPDHAQAVAFSPDTLQVLVGDRSGQLQARYPPTGQPLWATARATPVQAWAFAPAQNMWATVESSGTVRLYTGHNTLLHSLNLSPTAQPALAFSPNGEWLAVAGATVYLWNVRTQTGSEVYPNVVSALAFNRAASLLALGVGPNIVLLDPQTQTTWPLTGHTQPITALAFSPDGSQLISVSADASLRVWGLP